MSSSTYFESLLSSIRTKLPIQNPLHSFVHNNILLMFEGQDFHEALAEAASLYRARAYWPEEKYTERYKEGKISEQAIVQAIDHYHAHYNTFTVTEKLGLSAKEFLHLLMFSELLYSDDDVQPAIADSNLMNLCSIKMDGQSLTLKRSPVKWRAKEYWEKYYNESYVSSSHPYIIRLISSYLDQGQSFWINPFLAKGFWHFFCYDISSIGSFSADWLKELKKKVESYKNNTAQEVIERELTSMGIPQAEWEGYILEILFDLKGWSGMVNKLELEPWQASVKAPNIKLIDYIASLILIESAMDCFHAKSHSSDLSVIYGRKENIELKSFHLSLALYQITKSFKLEASWIQKFEVSQLLEIIEEIDLIEKVHRIRLWHEAYEHNFYQEALHALMSHTPELTEKKEPVAQVLFCIDDREESIRRHLEEIDPDLKTYGVVGFFGIDMKFASLKNQRLIAQCPPVISPSRIIMEISIDKQTSRFEKFNMFKGVSSLTLYYHSRTLFRGFFSTLILGFMSIIPMFMQVFFPKETIKIQKKFFNAVMPEPVTEIDIEQAEDHTHGYTKVEMAKIVEVILRMCGFKPPNAPLVVLVGHGSSSTNNPFKQAYGCGACGGNAGIPNSRAFAKMANDKSVRAELKKSNLEIPDSTYFVSGFHDTCTDEVHFFEIQHIPDSHKKTFQQVANNLEEAAKLNAFERCQKFSSDDAKHSPEEALKHVKERAQDLAQPRPEYGHSTNALAIVGKRDLTKGLFLNRRAFLLTYDWETDPQGSILKDVVLGGIPVAVNINMDYYFSSVDNDNFGCGSKLPLNLTSLLGVMTGSQSDLRIGLARQMVEIHEPIRNMTIIEAPLERVRTIFNSHPRLKNILYHHWLRLVVCDPIQKEWFIFGENDFKKLDKDISHLKHFSSSIDVINHTHSNEDFAEIDS